MGAVAFDTLKAPELCRHSLLLATPNLFERHGCLVPYGCIQPLTVAAVRPSGDLTTPRLHEPPQALPRTRESPLSL